MRSLTWAEQAEAARQQGEREDREGGGSQEPDADVVGC